MGGWKTWTGALGMIFGGIGLGFQALQGDGDLTAAIAMVTGGLGLIGIGDKIEKAGK